MLKGLLLLTAGLASLLSLCSAVQFFVTPREYESYYTRCACRTLDQYAREPELFQGHSNITLLFWSGTHRLTQSLNISGEAEQTVVNSSSRSQIQLIDIQNIFYTNVSLKGVDTLIETTGSIDHSTAIENSHFIKSALSCNFQQQNEGVKHILIQNTIFSGDYKPRPIHVNGTTINSLLSSSCRFSHCPVGLSIKCSTYTASNLSMLTLDIKKSNFNKLHSGIQFHCKSYGVSKIKAEDNLFAMVTNGIDIFSSLITQIAVINSTFNDYQQTGIGTTFSSLGKFSLGDYSTVSNLTIVRSNFSGPGNNHISTAIEFFLWNVDYVLVQSSQIKNTGFGISSYFDNYLSDAFFNTNSVIMAITITDCTISQNHFGLLLGNRTIKNCSIQDSTISNNFFGVLFAHSTAQSIEVISSQINRNSIGIALLESVATYFSIHSCTINQNHQSGMLYELAIQKLTEFLNIHIQNTIVSENNGYGIVLSNLSNNHHLPNLQHEISFENCSFMANGKSAVALASFGIISQVEDYTFSNNQDTAIVAFLSDVTLKGHVKFINNTGVRGGALSLIHSQVKFEDNSIILFTNNSAIEYGGAIYVASLKSLGIVSFKYLFTEVEKIGYNLISKFPCFYKVDSSGVANITVALNGNRANLGGDNIYGASVYDSCSIKTIEFSNFTLQFNKKNISQIYKFADNTTNSSITSDPTRACFCFNNMTECEQNELVYNDIRYPGEMFAVPLVLVGFDFGTVTQIVQANVVTHPSSPLNSDQQAQTADKDKCNWLNYSLHSEPGTHHLIRLTTRPSPKKRSDFQERYDDLHDMFCRKNEECIARLTTPIYVNITLEPCPLGFQLNKKTFVCECDETLTTIQTQENLKITCMINNHTGYIHREGRVWIGAENTANRSDGRYLWNQFCPQDYCRINQVAVDLENPDKQCHPSRSGTLCGQCAPYFSLPLGSDRCINCADNAGIALILVFLVAGLLLVLLIKFLDLTVASGTVNGIIFYANVVWGYNKILLPPPNNSDPLHWLTVPIAWINLDFGIEACFSVGLDAFVKAWLQFFFPLYIGLIASLIILIAHYSSRAIIWRQFCCRTRHLAPPILRKNTTKPHNNTRPYIHALFQQYHNKDSVGNRR